MSFEFDESELSFNEATWIANIDRNYNNYEDNENDNENENITNQTNNNDETEHDLYSFAESEEIINTEFYMQLLEFIPQSKQQQPKFNQMLLPQFNNYKLINETVPYIKLELTKSKAKTLVDHFENNRNLNHQQQQQQNDDEKFTYFIRNTNKNHFLINQTLTPLLYAAYINSYDLVHDLITCLNVDPNVTTSCSLSNEQYEQYKSIEYNKNSGYSKCICKNELDNEKYALIKCDLLATEVHYYTALMMAVMNNNYKLCEFLLNNNADVNILCATCELTCAYPSISAISLAIENSNYNILKLLVRHNGNLHERLWYYQTSHTHVLTLINKIIDSFETCDINSSSAIIDFSQINKLTLQSSLINDYLIKNELYLSYGDLFIIYMQLIESINSTYFMLNRVILLVKLLILNLNEAKYSIYELQLMKIFKLLIWHLINMKAQHRNDMKFLNINDCLDVFKLIIKFAYIGGLLKRKIYFIRLEQTTMPINRSIESLISTHRSTSLSLSSSPSLSIASISPSPSLHQQHNNLINTNNASSSSHHNNTDNSDNYDFSYFDYDELEKLNLGHLSSNLQVNYLFHRLQLYIEYEILNKPFDLKQLCRLKIKSSFKYYTKIEVNKLNLPNSLKEYLCFDII